MELVLNKEMAKFKLRDDEFARFNDRRINECSVFYDAIEDQVFLMTDYEEAAMVLMLLETEVITYLGVLDE